MAIHINNHLFSSLACVALSQSCVEPFEAKTDAFEASLVVDALLTDEVKKHEIHLGRAYSFEENIPTAERGAEIQIIDEMGKSHDFLESQPGTYLSAVSFAAEPGKSYELWVKTNNGRSYRSSIITTPQRVPIEGIRAERRNNDLGEEGVAILLDNESSTTEEAYYRFEYEETYKIIAPKWDPNEMEVIHYIACDTIPYEVGIKQRTEEQRVCYGSASSQRILQVTTSSLAGQTITDYEVRFVGRDNYILSHRYGINVRQYSQTQDAYSYYQSLKAFSSSDNIFSQVQPGFLQGNIFSETDTSEKVIGYFEVSSVSSKRIYFNYSDLFPQEPLPAYPINCETIRSPMLYTAGYHCAGFRVCDGDCESPLIESILAGLVDYGADNESPDADYPGPYLVWPGGCGDCTKLGSNVKPDFWED